MSHASKIQKFVMIGIFSYTACKARQQLAAIECNFHIGLLQKKSQSGEDMITQKYNPRTRQWDIKKGKCAKEFSYIPVLISHMIRRRNADGGNVAKKVDPNKSDPDIISATIGHIPPPNIKEFAAQRN